MNPAVSASDPYDPVMELARRTFSAGGDSDPAAAEPVIARSPGAPVPLRTQPRQENGASGPPGEPKKPHEAGSSRGVNIEPGSEDDGWVVPPPVTLSDGSR